MAVALICINPQSIVTILGEIPPSIKLPSGDHVEGAQPGWTGEGYALVDVTDFVAPARQQINGSPSYSFDANGNVIESYATQAIPVAPLTVTALAFRQLFTTAERLAITTAGETAPQIREFMDDESAAGEVNLADPEVTAGIAALVAGNLLTQDRTNQVLAGTAPST